MRTFIFIALSLLAVFLGAVTFEACSRRGGQSVEDARQRKADEVVGSIVYMKDSRTDICFAYLWRGAGNGGPALATVPCDSVPPNLLVTVK